MRVVLSYLDGKPQWGDNVPARGRVSGVGGSALGQVLAASVKPRKRLPRQSRNLPSSVRIAARCAFAMAHGSTCARPVGHPEHHRSMGS